MKQQSFNSPLLRTTQVTWYQRLGDINTLQTPRLSTSPGKRQQQTQTARAQQQSEARNDAGPLTTAGILLYFLFCLEQVRLIEASTLMIQLGSFRLPVLPSPSLPTFLCYMPFPLQPFQFMLDWVRHCVILD